VQAFVQHSQTILPREMGAGGTTLRGGDVAVVRNGLDITHCSAEQL
jgi:hypothetical protein